jgi:biopolymer transport protein ExbD
MLQTSILQKIIDQSVLGEQSPIRPSQKKGNRFPVAASLILTSLVDVFSILVIYLLVNSMTTTNEINPEQAIQLPTASITEEFQVSLMIIVKEGEVFIDKQIVAADQLEAYFAQWQEEHKDDEKAPTITIQADREADFEVINPILEIASQTGIRNFQLAILKEDKGT